MIADAWCGRTASFSANEERRRRTGAYLKAQQLLSAIMTGHGRALYALWSVDHRTTEGPALRLLEPEHATNKSTEHSRSTLAALSLSSSIPLPAPCSFSLFSLLPSSALVLCLQPRHPCGAHLAKVLSARSCLDQIKHLLVRWRDGPCMVPLC